MKVINGQMQGSITMVKIEYKALLTEEDYEFLIRQLEDLIEASDDSTEIKKLVKLIDIFEDYEEEEE